MTDPASADPTAPDPAATDRRGDDSPDETQPWKPGPNAPEGGWSDDDLVDEMSEESFPTSDPPSTWAG